MVSPKEDRCVPLEQIMCHGKSCPAPTKSPFISKEICFIFCTTFIFQCNFFFIIAWQMHFAKFSGKTLDKNMENISTNRTICTLHPTNWTTYKLTNQKPLVTCERSISFMKLGNWASKLAWTSLVRATTGQHGTSLLMLSMWMFILPLIYVH